MCRIALYQAPSVHVSAQTQNGESKAVAVGQVSFCLQVNRKETSNHGEVLGDFGFGVFFLDIWWPSICLLKKERHRNAHFTQDNLS